jgi:hypothetical protein
MAHKFLLDVLLRRFAVQQQEYLILGNIEAMGQPTLYGPGIVDARKEVPDASRFVVIDANDKCEDACCHIRL